MSAPATGSPENCNDSFEEDTGVVMSVQCWPRASHDELQTKPRAPSLATPGFSSVCLNVKVLISDYYCCQRRQQCLKHSFSFKKKICNDHVNVCTISPHLEWIDSPAESELFMSFARVMCNVVLVYCLSYEMTLFIPSSFILY